MMNVMLLSVAVWSGAEGATRDMFHWISAMIAIPTVIFAGQPFFRSAWASLRARAAGDGCADLAGADPRLVDLAVRNRAFRRAHAYFDAAVMLSFFLLAGPLP